ncbi:MAG: DUF2934 domain-containing protein [Proteobacteria bacterium]|nr:DUF2934 domain-containing protein [Pseudomonadota bacterium]
MATRRTTSTGSIRAVPPAQAIEPARAAQPAEKAVPGRRVAAPKPDAPSGAATGITVSGDARRAMIEQAAYLRSERRGFTPGGEVEDWLAAEAEVDALLRAGHTGPRQ